MRGCAHDPRTVISDHDQAQIDQFAEWLRQAGPTAWESKTEDQKAFVRAAYADPSWREFLDLPPLTEETT